jgi:hypothetical protein
MYGNIPVWYVQILKFFIQVELHWAYLEKFWRAQMCIFAVIFCILIEIGPLILENQILGLL